MVSWDVGGWKHSQWFRTTNLGLERDIHATESALTLYIDHLYRAIGKRNATVSVYLGFDTVNHLIFLGKLREYGVTGTFLKWFESYLSNRYQQVSIDGTFLALRPISIGVPQGSILGPLLFLTYINDLPNCIRSCHVHMDADDTVLYVDSSTSNGIKSKLDSDLHSPGQSIV